MSEEKDIVIITYRIDSEGEFFVDAILADYEPVTLERLSSLLASIPTVGFQVQTMAIIKNAFLEEGKDKELETLLSSVLLKSENFAKALEEKAKKLSEDKEDGEDEEDEPCIKPSDML
tara:strand:+ start:174 stop:527 length:354 start_codon:yes stop_codon:yes gene_type:complete